MKNIIILILGFWVFILYREKQKRGITPTPAPGASMQPATGGAALTFAAPAVARKSGEPAPALSVYGCTDDPTGNQRLTMEISAADTADFSPGDSVRVLNSNVYPLFYRIDKITTLGSVSAVTIGTRFIGAESETYLSLTSSNISGFAPFTTKPKSAFL